VLPIGGLKEKLLAAHRGGIEIIVIPEDNRKDIEDIPKNILKNLTIHCVKHMDEVLIHALAWDAQTSSRKKKDDLLARLQKITAQIPGKGSSGNTVKH
jgi:ATP-dependent Lon protease